MGEVAAVLLFDLIPFVGATLDAMFVGLATVMVDFPTATIVWVAFIIVWSASRTTRAAARLRHGAAGQPDRHDRPVLAGASLLGILGALLAIPTAAAIQIILRDWWANRESATPATQP